MTRTIIIAILTGVLVCVGCVEQIPKSSPMQGEGTLRVPQWEEFCQRNPGDPSC